jgi:hypothetical protein
MDWVYTAYWICLFVGLGYTVVAFILGEFTGTVDSSGHAGDAGAFSHDYGVDAGGSGEAHGSSVDGQIIFGPFSPLVIAFFLTCFGATGILLKMWGRLPDAPILLAATLSGFLLAWALITLLNRLLVQLQVNSNVRMDGLVGIEAEVSVEIPAQGVGEVAYVAMGARSTAPARSEDQVTIPRFSTVRIARVVGNIFFVRPVVADELNALANADTGGTGTTPLSG